jgi:hypothetical protein
MASQYFANRLAGVPMSPAEAAAAARAGIIASTQYSRVLAGLGQAEGDAPAADAGADVAPPKKKEEGYMGSKAMWAVTGLVVGFVAAKMMK